ncbi:MAG: hypothetical protein V4463_22930 [Pseudomonadota bacterium]
MPVTVHCINPACAKGMPRKVRFCPYCGTPQQALAAPARPAPAVQEARAAPAPPRPTPAPLRARPVSAPAQPRQAAAPLPRQRSRLGYWLLALLVLGLLWMAGRPDRQIEARVNAAVALTLDCKFNAAQAELAALKTARASKAQLERLQTAIDSAVGTCPKPVRRSPRRPAVTNSPQ